MEPRWLTPAIVRALHGQLLAEHGGLAGERDGGALESALGRPRNRLAYGEEDLFALAAAYGFGIVRNHPFADGNKRAALAAVDVFLQLNGYELTAPETEAVAMFLDLAAGGLTESAFAEWVRSRAIPLVRARGRGI